MVFTVLWQILSDTNTSGWASFSSCTSVCIKRGFDWRSSYSLPPLPYICFISPGIPTGIITAAADAQLLLLHSSPSFPLWRWSKKTLDKLKVASSPLKAWAKKFRDPIIWQHYSTPRSTESAGEKPGVDASGFGGRGSSCCCYTWLARCENSLI